MLCPRQLPCPTSLQSPTGRLTSSGTSAQSVSFPSAFAKTVDLRGRPWTVGACNMAGRTSWMSFPRRLASSLRALLAPGPVPLPALRLDPDDKASRFICSSGQFSQARVKKGAFMPETHPDTGRLETSVYVVNGLEDRAIWSLGDARVGTETRRVRARADFAVGCIEGTKKDGFVGFSVLRAEPPELHAVIVGWPAEKESQKALATELAGKAELHIKKAAKPHDK